MQSQDVGTVAKIVEISSQSQTSFQDAIERGIDQGKIVAYRVIMKITFVLDGPTNS